MRPFVLLFSVAVSLAASTVRAEIVAGPLTLYDFSAATTIHSQGGFPISDAIDGNDQTGWAIGFTPISRSAFFTLDGSGVPLGGAGTNLSFRVESLSDVVADHVVGHFRLSATTDSAVNGASAWIELTPLTASRMSGGVVTINPGVGPANSVLLTDDDPVTDVTTVTAFADPNTFMSNITGIRLEVLEVAGNGLPGGGPGTRSAIDGNFILSELELHAATLDNVVAIPEPSTLALFGLALGGMGGLGYWQRRR